MDKELTPRQWALKRYLENNFISGHFFSIEHLVSNVIMPDGSMAYSLNTDPYKHDKCIALSNDVKDINWSCSEGYKILVKDSKGGVKLCESRQEFEDWRQKELAPVIKKYQYLNNLVWKSNRDGVVPIINQANNPIDYEKSDAKPIEVFVDNPNKKVLTSSTAPYVDIWGNPQF